MDTTGRRLRRRLAGGALGALALLGTATGSAVATTVGSGGTSAGAGCVDYVIDGLGDCRWYLLICGAVGGHIHAAHHSGPLAHVDYTCHPGRRHRHGD